MSDNMDKVGTDDTCPKCGKWKGPMHTCPNTVYHANVKDGIEPDGQG